MLSKNFRQKKTYAPSASVSLTLFMYPTVSSALQQEHPLIILFAVHIVQAAGLVVLSNPILIRVAMFLFLHVKILLLTDSLSPERSMPLSFLSITAPVRDKKYRLS